MVHCVKFDKELPGLDRVPWKGESAKRVYENVSKDAWKLWIEHSKMVMNEYRLNPIDPNSQKIMEEQMEQFFFGAGAKLPKATSLQSKRLVLDVGHLLGHRMFYRKPERDCKSQFRVRFRDGLLDGFGAFPLANKNPK